MRGGATNVHTNRIEDEIAEQIVALRKTCCRAKIVKFVHTGKYNLVPRTKLLTKPLIL